MTELAIIFLVASCVTAVGAFGGKLRTAHFELEILSPRQRRFLRWAGGAVMVLALGLMFVRAVREVLPKTDAPANAAATAVTGAGNGARELIPPGPTTNSANAVTPASNAVPPQRAEPSDPAPPIIRQPRRARRETPPAQTVQEPVETRQPTVQNNCVISGGTNYGTQNQVCIR